MSWPEFVAEVFPTPVGVFLELWPSGVGLPGLPHARGGVSAPQYSAAELERSSPRPWGCFLLGPPALLPVRVFPTPVGVFLRVRAR